uniref:Uncharacterized protein n=1 Tax=Oncorhynchus tshawytscha TaxID=74940 RepID=A0A8C8IL47_ONCTS
MRTKLVAVIRAGVSGLSTAQSIYEHYHSTVSQSTSDGPAGFWQPYLYDKGNSQKTSGLTQFTCSE